MKLTIDYNRNTIRLPLGAYRRLRTDYPLYKNIDFSYTTSGKFYLVLSTGVDLELEDYTVGPFLQFTSINFLEAAKKYLKEKRTRSFDIASEASIVADNLLYFLLSPDNHKIQNNRAAVARYKIKKYEKYDFPGRIKTNEIKVAEQILKAS